MNYLVEETQYINKEFDLAEFRNVAAGYVRSLILACLKHEPGIFPDRIKALWKVKDYHQDAHTAEYHLKIAALFLAELNTKFLDRCGSGGIATSEESQIAELMSLLAFFTIPEGGAPDHNSQIHQLIRALRTNQECNWREFAQWENLELLRKMLDGLPETPGEIFIKGNLKNNADERCFTIKDTMIWVNLKQAMVKTNSVSINFSKTRLCMNLFVYLLEHNSKYVSLGKILDNWSRLKGRPNPVESTVRSAIHRLNTLLEPMQLKIENLKGYGYKLKLCSDREVGV